MTKKYVQDIAVQCLMNGDEVFIVTKRMPDVEVKKLAFQLGIKQSNIIFTSHRPKWTFLKNLKIDEHYDDMIDEINEINKNTSVKTHHAQKEDIG